MVKLVTVLLAALLVVACQSSIIGRTGAYRDRPELLGSSEVKALVSYAAEQLALKDNIILDDVKVTGVQTQVVAGTNYKINFTARPVNGASVQMQKCEAIIYVRFDSTKTLTSAHCA